VVRAYKYRLHPTTAQEAILHATLWRLRELYNAALQERRDAYQKCGVSISAYQQMAQLKDVRAAREDIATIHVHLLQDAITRLDRAFRAFFRRCKAGEKPGYPRFRGRDRYHTFTFKDAGKRNGVRFVSGGRRLYLHGIGKLRIRMHRPMQGTLKQVSITLSGGHWYACMVCDDVPVRPLPATGQSVGVDVGITTFAALSTGEQIESPRPYRAAQRKLAKLQRVVSRRKKRSARRCKAVRVLAGQHARVARIRSEFHHCAAKALVERFDSICVEDLNIKGLAAGMLAKHVHDAGWAQFTKILAGKAECAGRELIKVDPRGTSQECSGCGAVVRKTLAERVHRCPCGTVLDRDHNSAIVVEGRGRRLRGGLSSGRPEEPRSPILAH
jgi:putative transposase